MYSTGQGSSIRRVEFSGMAFAKDGIPYSRQHCGLSEPQGSLVSSECQTDLPFESAPGWAEYISCPLVV